MTFERGMVLSSTSICPNVGDRIECAEYFGTIKYIGSIEGYSGTWLGVDWDDPRRGKHDGTVNNVQYFVANYRKSGSFVRPEKVQLGQSAISAITSRYGQRDDEITAQVNRQQLLSIQRTINAPFLEMVGFEKIANKQRNFNNLEIINLRLQNIKTIGGPLELKNLCPNVKELDISKNLLISWSSIFEICFQLEHLTWLNVSQNFLEIPEDYTKFNFPNLKTLICGSMNLTWEDVIKLSSIFPNVEELRVPSNKITHLETPVENNFQHVKMLDLECNDIKEWKKVCCLSVFPVLDYLNLDNTGLESIHFENCAPDEKLKIFRNLKKLVLSQNLIKDWESIGELNKLENLEDLRFLKNPILEAETYSTCVQLIIARIKNLKVFNATEIKSDERNGAEYDYIKKYGLEWLSVQGTEKQVEFLQKHNRYFQLIEKHGTPQESELKIQTNKITGTLVELEITYNEQSIVKKLPQTILIQKLIMLIQRLFNLDERPELLYISGAQPDIEIILDDECKELGYYSVQNGDRIIVKI